MSKIWPQDIMRKLLTEAETEGHSQAKLASNEEAHLFRFALYYLRRQEKIGNNISITVDGHWVILTKKTTPKIELIYNEARKGA